MKNWKDEDLDRLLLALTAHPQVGYYLRKNGLGLKIKEAEERRNKKDG